MTSAVLSLLAEEYYRPIDIPAQRGRSVSQIISSLHDPYTRFLSPQALTAATLGDGGAFGGIGINLVRQGSALVVRSTDPGGPARRAGIRPGDALTAVDGHPVAGATAGRVAKSIRGRVGTPIVVTVLPAGGAIPNDVALTRRKIVVPVVAAKMLTRAGQRVGYLRLTSFTNGSADTVARQLRRLRAARVDRMVIDLRGNGGGSVRDAYRIAGHLLPRGSTVLRMQGLHYPAVTYSTRTHPIVPTIPLVVLVDRASASASEILTAALRDNGRATVVGERTFGKAVVQDRRPLPGGAALSLTVARYLTPSGSDLNHRGLTPDRIARDIATTKIDEALELAATIAR